LRIYQYKLPFKSPLKLAKQTLHYREGLIIELRHQDNSVSFGEIAPFPMLHQETLAMAKSQLIKICEQSITDINFQTLYPSVRFGIESALFDFKSYKNMNKLIKVNGLLVGDSTREQSKFLLKNGYQSLKVKVSNVNHNIENIHFIRTLNKNISIRLDANCTFTLEQAIDFGNKVNKYNIEYIEEPLKIDNITFNEHLEQLDEFYKMTKIPVALDETLQAQILKKSDIFASGIQAFILKPSTFNGFKEMFKYSQYARQNNIKIVISSPFHSGIGLNTESMLAGILTDKNTAAGLDTWRYFKHDVLKKPLHTHNGFIKIKNEQISLLSSVERIQ
jgi:O-succinylbenzoate synthase